MANQTPSHRRTKSLSVFTEAEKVEVVCLWNEQKRNTASQRNQFDLKIRAVKAADFRHIVDCTATVSNVADKRTLLSCSSFVLQQSQFSHLFSLAINNASLICQRSLIT